MDNRLYGIGREGGRGGSRRNLLVVCLCPSLPDDPEVIKHSSSLKLPQKIAKVANWSFRALDSFSFGLFSRNLVIFDFPLWSLQPFVLAFEHNNLLLNNGEKNLELFRSKGLFALLQCELMTQIWSVLLASSSLLIFCFCSRAQWSLSRCSSSACVSCILVIFKNWYRLCLTLFGFPFRWLNLAYVRLIIAMHFTH